MSIDPLLSPALPTGPSHEAEYDAVYAAVTETERGRWFLSEYAKRNRRADTDLVAAAIARMEAAVCGDAPQSSAAAPPSPPPTAAAIERIEAAIAAKATPPVQLGGAEPSAEVRPAGGPRWFI